MSRRLVGALVGALVVATICGAIGGLVALGQLGRRGVFVHHLWIPGLWALVGAGLGLPLGAIVARPAPRGLRHRRLDADRRALLARTLLLAGLLAIGLAAPAVVYLLAGPMRDAAAQAVAAASPLGLSGVGARVVLAGSVNAALAVAFASALVGRSRGPRLGLGARLGAAAAGLSIGFFGPLELGLALSR